MPRKKVLVLIAGTAVFLGFTFILHHFIPLVENAFYDLSFSFRSPQSPDTIIVVGIDDKSIREGGGWPWSRSLMASLVERIEAGGPRTLALDFLFPVRRDAEAASDSLEEAFSRVSGLVLPFKAGNIHQREVVGAAVIPREALPYRFLMVKNRERLDEQFFYYTKVIDIADPRFVEHARRGGFLNVSTRRTTQKLREVIHVIKAGNEYFPSFGCAAVAAYRGLKPDELVLTGKPSILLGDTPVKLTSYAGSALLNFRGGQGTIRTIPAIDVLTGRIDPSVFEDKLVFVGITDPAVGVDFFVTPVSPQFPGVEIWATAAADLLHATYLRHQDGFIRGLNWLLAFLLFPGLAFLIPNRKKQLAVAGGAAILALSVVLWIVLFRTSFIFWNPGYHVYAWIFSLLWLAVQKADPTLVEVARTELEPEDPGDADAVPPPAQSDFITQIPASATANFVAEILGMPAGASAIPAGTLVESEVPEGGEAAGAPLAEFQKLAGGRIVRLLGSGGMADVYLIWNPRLEVYRAVKVIKPGLNDQLVERFETEIRIFANLSHANIVQCYSAGEWHMLPYLEMEYVPGAPMDLVLASCKVLTPEQTIALGILVCRALQYAHQKVVNVYGNTYKGVIHRDLKPANVMLSRGGKVKLTDFGIARPQAVSLHTSDTSRIVGTLPYLAPEQLDGKELTSRTDVYALGLTLYEFLTGERAYMQSDMATLVNAIAKGQVRSLKGSTLAPGALADIIHTAIATDPKDRYESALAMERELERALHGLAKDPGPQFLAGLVKRYWG
ncbi:MAG: CHASE2 domain-containing protein [Chitinivibrionales bacterium]|nr:CHASE2 domain-containing protein [Chitinivibrionales bacterium]MBD3397302.1 CHASE2 domain-containing protein [Chitinivibrionales bacterium]